MIFVQFVNAIIIDNIIKLVFYLLYSFSVASPSRKIAEVFSGQAKKKGVGEKSFYPISSTSKIKQFSIPFKKNLAGGR